MHHALELLFDEGAEAAVLNAWRGLRDAGFGAKLLDLGARPHVSLGVYDRPALAEARQALEAFFASEAPVGLQFSSVGSFPGDEGVVFLAPVVTGGLLGLHSRYHEHFTHLREAVRPHYLPDAWVPHCTVGFGVPCTLLPAAIEFARTAKLPICGTVERIAVIEFEDGLTGAIRTLLEVPLGG